MRGHRGALRRGSTTRPSPRAVTAALVVALLAGSGAASAEEPASAFEFTFSSPGARSMGFAGAFVPVADDATAAFANPAGLVQLVRPEVSLELRLRGVLESDEEGNSTLGAVSGVSFFSAVVPVGRWSFALYGHQLASLDFKSTDTAGSAAAGVREASGERLKELSVGRLGLAAAFRLRDNLTLGLGISHFESTVELAPLGDASAGTRHVTSTDWGLNAGVLWNPSERVRLGGFYRQGPSLDNSAAPSATSASGNPLARTLELPDSYGLGAAVRSRGGALTLAFEWDRVRYSTLDDGLSAIAGGDEGLSIDDADELHLGAEYAFLKVNPVLAARAGFWFDPDHRACSSTPGSPYVCDDESGDEVHATAGFGLAFRKFQLDLGIDQSRSLVAFSISGIVSF
ncbi:MAG TPA: outer membrane protein transport protein [Thermoanaerobaculaceae bacterium]|nr:outer membrane protein transport protein [Thermoanaerobaculaceae bacterium]